ncbi:hypothetical protein [Cesiribacter andamanensis]|uniref:hypothetical protein n=1 Tax=Cesiribacter andamanensis TaxID=649507 RepID=UPI00034DF594|nr:hypothetical protein [Cesiribacter andamanensis]
MALGAGGVQAQIQSMNLLQDQSSVEIPFRRVNNLILIKVLLDNAIPLEFYWIPGCEPPS